jgi:hypothetical protein
MAQAYMFCRRGLTTHQGRAGQSGAFVGGVGQADELVARGLDLELVFERVGFNGPDAVEAPVGGAHFLDDAEFDAVGRLETAFMILHEDFEVSGGFAGEGQTLGKQAVLHSVLRRTLFPAGVVGPWDLAPLAREDFFLLSDDITLSDYQEG